MVTNTMPPCFCDEESMSCDWAVNVTIEYSRPGHPEMVASKVEWELAQIPQLLAQALVQASVSAVNEKGAEVYGAWAQGCFDGDTTEQMIARVRGMI